MQTNDSDRIAKSASNATREVGALSIITLEVGGSPTRRSKPRRQNVLPVAIERRQTERRQRKPGVDGLLRTVLADEWR